MTTSPRSQRFAGISADGRPFGQAVRVVQLPPYNGAAIASVVCAALWGFGLASLAAVVFGLVGIKNSADGTERGTAMAVIGLVGGLLGVLLMTLLLLTPLTVADLVGGSSSPAPVLRPSYGYGY